MKVEDGEIVEDPAVTNDAKKKQSAEEGNTGAGTGNQDGNPSYLQQSGWSRRDGNQRPGKRVNIMSCIVAE